MDVISARDASIKWGISQRRVAILCAENRIPGAQILGNMWLIPEDAKKPEDGRNLRYKEMPTKDVKPFLKWAGGKGQLLSKIGEYYPKKNSNITKYCEPFIGGGAVFFDIISKYKFKEVLLTDINPELVNAYIQVRDNVEQLIEQLKVLQKEYLAKDELGRKNYYLKNRDRYNELIKNGSEKDNLEKAVLMLFINRTCFNGLYRVNSKGLYNVPAGKYTNPLICNDMNLRNVSKCLQGVQIRNGDFTLTRDFIDENTFVYCDPPYRPITEGGFNSYDKSDFNDDEQIRLAKYIEEMNQKGASILLSNSDPKNADQNDDFFDDLYSKFNINRVYASRNINSDASGRGKITELLIANC